MDTTYKMDTHCVLKAQMYQKSKPNDVFVEYMVNDVVFLHLSSIYQIRIIQQNSKTVPLSTIKGNLDLNVGTIDINTL